MKKKLVVEALLSIFFLVSGVVLLFFLPNILGQNAFFNNFRLLRPRHGLNSFATAFNFNGTSGIFPILMISFIGVAGVLLILEIIFIISKKKPIYLFAVLLHIIATCGLLYLITVFFAPNFFEQGVDSIGLKDINGNIQYGLDDKMGGYITFALEYVQHGALGVGWLILSYVPVLVGLIGLVLFVVFAIGTIGALATIEMPEAEEDEDFPASKKLAGDEKRIIRVYEGDV